MASSSIVSLLAILLVVLQPWSASGNFLSPLLAPIFDNDCKYVTCGKGTCKTGSNFFYECECDPGWRQFDHRLKFLPCVIPNSTGTIDYSCSSTAPTPAPVEWNHDNGSYFDPCEANFCGGGSCHTISNSSHQCECYEGYSNLFNVTSFPCLRQCSLGADCADLGLSLTNHSTNSSAPTSTSNTNSQGQSVWKRGFFWLMIAIASSLATA